MTETAEKFFMTIRSTGNAAPSKRIPTEQEAIVEASRLAQQSQERYYILETTGFVEPTVAPVNYSPIQKRN